MDEQKDSQLKYLEMPTAFRGRATEIDILCKQSQRTCVMLAKHLAKERPKTPLEFERHEYLKDFVGKTADTNEKVLQLITHIHELLQGIATDAEALTEGAKLRDQLRDQSDAIVTLMQTRDKSIQAIYDLKRNTGFTEQPTSARA